MTIRLALAGLLIAGCGSGTPAAPTLTGGPVNDLRIGLAEYRLQLSAGAVQAGLVTVVVTNAGSARHDVRLRQGGRLLAATHVLAPGGRQRLSFRVDPATPVRLDCTLTGHAAAGMTGTLAVG